jgi:outer membrane protein assembly factor BamB
LLWKCAIPALGERGSDGAAYSSAIVADIAGVRQYVQVVGRGVIGVAADTGRFLWGYNRLGNTIASITSPIARGNYVFTANSYNTGSALLEIKRSGDKWQAAEAYVLPAKTFENHHGGVVLVGDHLYGGSGLNKGDPACIEFATGKVLWKPKAPAAGSACVLYADGHLIFRYDRGLVILVEANPKEFRVKSQFVPPRTNAPAWAYPVIHQRKLYLRDQNLLLCYDLSRT